MKAGTIACPHVTTRQLVPTAWDDNTGLSYQGPYAARGTSDDGDPTGETVLWEGWVDCRVRILLGAFGKLHGSDIVVLG